MSDETTPEQSNVVYVVLTASDRAPGVYGAYGKVAVALVDEGSEPAMISERARGVHKIVWQMNRLYKGKTDKSAYYVALKEAEEIARKYNGF